MQLLMVLSKYSPFISGRHLVDVFTISLQSHRPSSRLEIILMDIDDTSHNHHPSLQDMAYENIHEGL